MLLLLLLVLLLLQPVLPGWTFQPSALQELWLADPDDESDLDWAARAPQLSPSLVPLVDGECSKQLAAQLCTPRLCLDTCIGHNDYGSLQSCGYAWPHSATRAVL